MRRALELLLAAWLMLLWPVFAVFPMAAPAPYADPFGGMALAVQPDEMLTDAALESRARAISAELRCLVCQNQSIDDSDAALARDLRLVVRDRLKAGDSDEGVLDYVVARYGEFVLLRPRLETATLILWGTPIALLLAGGAYALAAARSRRPPSAASVLDADEERRVEELLRRQGS